MKTDTYLGPTQKAALPLFGCFAKQKSLFVHLLKSKCTNIIKKLKKVSALFLTGFGQKL
jgi:hypothetical protein